MNLQLIDYTVKLREHIASAESAMPWHLTKGLASLLQEKLAGLPGDFLIRDNVAIHRSATIEDGVVLKGPLIISAGVFVGAHAYLRGGVFLAPQVSVGPGCEIKTSIILDNTALAHFNFVGDSIIGSYVNMEAGSIIANHHNDRDDKTIFIRVRESLMRTDSIKFGALVGDGSKIGANAVLCPGTILPRNTIVRRLELVAQDGN